VLTAERREPDAVVGTKVAIDQAERGAVGQQHIRRALRHSQLGSQIPGQHRAVRSQPGEQVELHHRSNQ
jgi:hypothetical protein